MEVNVAIDILPWNEFRYNLPMRERREVSRETIIPPHPLEVRPVLEPIAIPVLKPPIKPAPAEPSQTCSVDIIIVG